MVARAVGALDESRFHAPRSLESLSAVLARNHAERDGATIDATWQGWRRVVRIKAWRWHDEACIVSALSGERAMEEEYERLIALFMSGVFTTPDLVRIA